MEELRHFELGEQRGGPEGAFLQEDHRSWVIDRNPEPHSRRESTTQRESISRVPPPPTAPAPGGDQGELSRTGRVVSRKG